MQGPQPAKTRHRRAFTPRGSSIATFAQLCNRYFDTAPLFSLSVLLRQHITRALQIFATIPPFYTSARKSTLPPPMKRISRLIYDAPDRQSKLSQEQLQELQRSTHFDKKELQQWYKGQHAPNPRPTLHFGRDTRPADKRPAPAQ